MRFDDLGEGPEGDALAVGETAALAPGDEPLGRFDVGEELGDEAALADAGLADDEGDLRRRGVGRLVEQGGQVGELGGAADERRRPLEHLGAGPRQGLLREPRLLRLALALGGDRLERLVDDRLAGELVGHGADDDAHGERRPRDGPRR